MDDTLKALLRYVKQNDFETSWQAVRDNVFAPLYHPQMSFLDVMEVLVKAYEVARAEPRFALGTTRIALKELILSPIRGINSVEWFGPQTMDTQYTVEQFYASMIRKMLSDLRHTRVDWCKSELTV